MAVIQIFIMSTESTDSIATPSTISSSPSYNRYGFTISALQNSLMPFLLDDAAQKQREIKWLALLPRIAHLRYDSKESEKELIDSVRLGIADSYRSRVWPRLILPPLNSYDECSGLVEYSEISRDLMRTFPLHQSARSIESRMGEVLNALAVALPKLGYCQGMNFIVGILLLKLDNQQAFDMAYHILHWQKHARLLMNLERVNQKFHVLEKLMAKHFPKLQATLAYHSIDTLIYASSWFITLFCNCLPACYAFRILQSYLLQGDKVIYRVALMILKTKKKKLKTLDNLEAFIDELKNYEEFNEANLDRFMSGAFSIKVSRQEIKQYEEEYQQQQAQKLQA